MDKFNQLVQAYQQIVPLRIKYKDQSSIMLLLNGVVRWFNPDFMTHYTTVVGNTIYFPSTDFIQENTNGACRTLAHEVVHLLDQRKRTKPIFILAYLFPQILALGVFTFVWWEWWSLTFLIFLLPFPAHFRFYFETRAYAVTVLTHHSENREAVIDWVGNHFTSWHYYKMFPFPKKVRKQVEKWIQYANQNQDKTLMKVLLVYESVNQ